MKRLRKCAVVLLVGFAVGIAQVAARGDPASPPRPGDPLLFSTSCRPTPEPKIAWVQHYFKGVDGDPVSVPAAVDLVVSHGGPLDLADFSKTYSHVERLPVFVSASRNVENLDQASVRAVLTGEVTSWDQLGSSKGRIDIYLHGGELQKKALQSYLRLHGIDLDATGAIPSIRYLPSYRALADAARQDPDAFVIGLRDPEPAGLKTISIDGEGVLDPAAPYPLTYPVEVYARPTTRAEGETKEWMALVRSGPADAY